MIKIPKLNPEAKTRLKIVISRVNASLKYYEANWISVQRCPETEKIRITSLKDFVEMRFNYELYKLPEFRLASSRTEGRLFKCLGLDGINEEKHKYKLAHFKLANPEELGFKDEELLKETTELINEITNLLGGTNIRFTSVENKIRVELDNDYEDGSE